MKNKKAPMQSPDKIYQAGCTGAFLCFYDKK
jgi:hypothetical protein